MCGVDTILILFGGPSHYGMNWKYVVVSDYYEIDVSDNGLSTANL